jgi:hypothetical protein
LRLVGGVARDGADDALSCRFGLEEVISIVDLEITMEEGIPPKDSLPFM